MRGTAWFACPACWTPTHPGTRRRTLTLRFFGEDAVYDPREGGAGPRIAGFPDRMKAGDPFRHPGFLRLV